LYFRRVPFVRARPVRGTARQSLSASNFKRPVTIALLAGESSLDTRKTPAI